MRAKEFILEVKLGTGGTVDTQKYGSSTVDQRGPGLALPRDQQGRPIEPGLEQPMLSPEDLIGLGATSVVRNLAKKGAELGKNVVQTGYRKIEPQVLGLNPARPKADNVVSTLNKSSYGQAPDPVAGRFPATQKDITHAQRTITSQSELDDLRKTGYATAGKDPNKHIGRGIDQYTGKEKWWSPADSQGRLGRNEFPGTKPVADIRVPMNKLPNGRAVSTKDMEIQDPVTGEWGPFK
jgi:hypothetical protein